MSGQWTAGKVTCTANSEPTYSAYWVGLGGGGQQSSALEQIGTQADCSTTGVARYYAWYELVPSAPVKIALTINAGDSIWARTAVSGDQVSLYIRDQTTKQTWSKTLTMTAATPDTSTAEWVAEAPSECANGTTGECTPLPLANFGTVSFKNAHTTSNGHVGSIDDSNWTAEAIELEPSSDSAFGGGPGGYLQGGYGSSSLDSSYATSSEGAAPTALSKDGTSFSVKYGATLTAQSSGAAASQGNANPYTYSGGSGYSGYGGYGYGYGGYGGYYGGGYGQGDFGYGDAYYGGWGY